jgi:hypothetical protein
MLADKFCGNGEYGTGTIASSTYLQNMSLQVDAIGKYVKFQAVSSNP